MKKRNLTPEEKRKLRTKILLAGAAGTALGSATAYAAVQGMKNTKYGKDFGRLPGGTRAEYLVPAAIGFGVGAYGANYMRQKAKRQAELRALEDKRK
jgi:hypothetical protein